MNYLLTYGRLQRCGHHAPGGLLSAGEERDEGGEQGQHRVARHDDRVGAHTPGASESGMMTMIVTVIVIILVLLLMHQPRMEMRG